MKLTTPAPATPRELTQAGPDHLRIRWQDEHESLLPVRYLRLCCRCAHCVEELTGRPLLKEEEVPEDVRPHRISPVGRYGVRISWSDGHDTGIYTFKYLRELCTSGSPPAPARDLLQGVPSRP